MLMSNAAKKQQKNRLPGGEKGRLGGEGGRGEGGRERQRERESDGDGGNKGEDWKETERGRGSDGEREKEGERDRGGESDGGREGATDLESKGEDLKTEGGREREKQTEGSLNYGCNLRFPKGKERERRRAESNRKSCISDYQFSYQGP